MFAAAKNKHSETLKTQQIKINTSIHSMTRTLQRNKAILTSNIASDFTDYKSELNSYRSINKFMDSTKPILKVNTLRGKNMSIEVEKTKASLTLTSLDRPLDKFPLRRPLPDDRNYRGLHVYRSPMPKFP